MNEEKDTAEGLLKRLGIHLGVISKEEAEVETEDKADVKMEEETTGETAEVKFASELAEGEYELKDGTIFKIDAEGNVVDVVAPTEDEAETEEAEKDAEDMESKENLEESKLSSATKKIEELEAQVTELSATKPISSAPQKKETVKLNRYSNNRPVSTLDRVMARLAK